GTRAFKKPFWVLLWRLTKVPRQKADEVRVAKRLVALGSNNPKASKTREAQWPRMHPRSQGQADEALVGHNRPPKRPVFEPSQQQ
ncbi:hypothetical protein, partial [Wenzhouxiangella sp. XN79A]|uniref:hypothetical protein n=1 Tax=Wenzhouxiangella sp. XN79A TaxID=2724193 RepID=UPI001981C516